MWSNDEIWMKWNLNDLILMISHKNLLMSVNAITQLLWKGVTGDWKDKEVSGSYHTYNPKCVI